jgi:branched-chain amino acid transport system substrate-binding protein
VERIRRRARARAVVLAAPRAQAGPLLREIRDRGIRLPILGPDAVTGIQSEGPVAEGVFISSNYLTDLATPANVAFLRAYTDAYPGELPDHRGAGAYDAVQLIAGAIQDAGTSRRDVRNGLLRLGRGRDPYDGVTGSVSFDARGEVPRKQVHIGVLRGGSLVSAEAR